MSPEREYDRKLETLVSAMIDGTMSETEEVRLGALLRDHPEAQQAYLDLCLTHALLRQELGALPEASALEPSRWPLISSGMPWAACGAPGGQPAAVLGGFLGSVALCYVLAALMITAGVIATWAWNRSQQRDLATEPVHPAAEAADGEATKIGRIVRLVACRWAQNATPIREAANVALGEKFTMDSGRLEMVYDTGLMVALDGPATFIVDSPLGGFLSQGSLTVQTGTKSGTEAVIVPGEKSRLPPAGAEFDRLSRSLTIIRTPTAVASQVDADFRVDVDRSGATVVRVSRGTMQLQLAGDGPERGVAMHGNWQARVEMVGIFRGITVAGGPASAGVPTTYTSREGLAMLIAGEKTAAVANPGWQFVHLDCAAVAKEGELGGGERGPRRPENPSVEIKGKAKSRLTYRAEFEPCRDRPPTVRPRVVASYAARNRLIAVRLNGKELPGPWRASEEAAQQFGALAIDEGFRAGVNVLEVEVLTDVFDPVKDPPLQMSGAVFGFRQVHATVDAPSHGHSSELRL